MLGQSGQDRLLELRLLGDEAMRRQRRRAHRIDPVNSKLLAFENVNEYLRYQSPHRSLQKLVHLFEGCLWCRTQACRQRIEFSPALAHQNVDVGHIEALLQLLDDEVTLRLKVL